MIKTAKISNAISSTKSFSKQSAQEYVKNKQMRANIALLILPDGSSYCSFNGRRIREEDINTLFPLGEEISSSDSPIRQNTRVTRWKKTIK